MASGILYILFSTTCSVDLPDSGSEDEADNVTMNSGFGNSNVYNGYIVIPCSPRFVCWRPVLLKV